MLRTYRELLPRLILRSDFHVTLGLTPTLSTRLRYQSASRKHHMFGARRLLIKAEEFPYCRGETGYTHVFEVRT